ncbi:hypothetical protein Fleli_3655 [Bernardetia litoralis DSM 6794]|uniref:Uncharacterized protein n=1 Tax=Bernardetia litoralis (strain ATCC 23117 / DSM 6794 / NBRC 15988 / NCIMB 1366 / Fx l1 / Sio-4) TaxID=880071 RepID=I4APT5_BERLS|nr:hypothetical protein [Bernardetia litoralis]AFM05970.1 hypothetical protein Fleli_3655 [Bernardetia litoralis DSM 6794]
MKKILFLIVALVSMLTCLFYVFDASFFENKSVSNQEKEITRIGDSTHFLIFDTTYNAGIISETSLVAEHIVEVLPNIFYRGTTDLNRVYATYKNDSLELVTSGIVGASVKIIITEDKVESTAKLFDCTYNYDYKPLKSKIIINSKTLDFSDSLDVYFDMSFIYTEENGKYIDTMVVKGTTRIGKNN